MDPNETEEIPPPETVLQPVSESTSQAEKTFSPGTPGSPKLFPVWGIIVLALSIILLISVGLYALTSGLS